MRGIIALFTLSVLVVFKVTEGAIVGGAARDVAVEDWFPEVDGNLTRVDWAHAVNDRAYLTAALASEVMMLEADIVLGHLVGSEDGPAIPVMAHPPNVTSDISLADFLAAVADHNRLAHPQKGVKLDFKSIEAFEASEDIIAHLSDPEVQFQVWFNADILSGPVDSQVTPVDATRFLKLAVANPRAVLSIGWTTNYGGDITSGQYETSHTNAMLEALRENNVSQPVTYPVRAGLAATSEAVLLKLLKDTQDLDEALQPTLTVWSSEGDPVDVERLRALILEVGLDRTFLDVPVELSSQLHLPDQLSK